MFAQWNEISRQVSSLVSNDDGSVDADSYLSDSSVSSLNDELLSVLGNSYSEFYERSKPVIRRLASMTHGTVARCRLSKRKFAGTSNYFFNKMTNNEAHALQLYANTVSFIHFGCKKLESEIVFMVHLDKMEKMLTEGLCQILSELCNLIGQIQAGEYPVTDEKTRVRLVPVYSTLTVRNDVVQNIQKIDKKMLDEESARSTGSSSSVSTNSNGEDSNEEARTPSPPNDVPKSHLLLTPTPRPSEIVKGNESANRDVSNRTLGIEEESEDEDPFAEERVQTAVSPIGIEDVSFDKRDETDEVEGEEEDTLGFMEPELSSDAQTLDTLTRRLREIRERSSELREASPDTMSSASSSPPDILDCGGSSPARALWIDKLEEGLSEVTGLQSPTSTRKADKSVDGEVNKATTPPEQDTKFQTFLKSMDDDTKWKNKAIPPPFLLHHPHFALRHKTPKLLLKLKPSKVSEVQKESEKEEDGALETRQTVVDKLATLDFVECEAQKVDRDVNCGAVDRSSPPPPRKLSVDPCDTSIGYSEDQLLQPIGGIPPEEHLFLDIGDLTFDAEDPAFLTTENSAAEKKINKGAVSPKKSESTVVVTTTPEKPKEKVRIGTPPPKSYTPGGRPRRFSLDTNERTLSTKDTGRSPVKRSLFNSLSQSPPRDENLQVDEFPPFLDNATVCTSPSKGVKSIPYGSPPTLGDSLLSSPSSKASPLKISPLSVTSPLSGASPRSATLQQIPEAEEGSATQFFANETTNTKVQADSPTKADRSPSVVARTESGSPLKTLFQLPFRNKRVSGVKDSSPAARSTVSSGSKSPAKKKQNTFLRNLFPTRGSSNDTSDSNC